MAKEVNPKSRHHFRTAVQNLWPYIQTVRWNHPMGYQWTTYYRLGSKYR